MVQIDIDAPCGASHAEVVALFASNEIEFEFAADNDPGQVLAMLLPAHQLTKAQALLDGLGSEPSAQPQATCDERCRLVVRLSRDRHLRQPDFRYSAGRPGPVLLADHLADQDSLIDANELNHMASQVMDLYYALLQGDARQVDDDVHAWFYAPTEQRVIVPWKAAVGGSPEERAQRVYRGWSACRDRLDRATSKPTKHVYPPEQQQLLLRTVRERLLREVASLPGVRRIHLMGACLRGDMGRYTFPFVHGRQVRAGSSIDVLIEIDPAREQELPASWTLYMGAAPNNGCAIHHLGEIPLLEGIAKWQAAYPAIPFKQHLIEAYVFLPSRCDAARKDAFLAEFQAQLLYDRDSAATQQAEAKGLAAQLEAQYPLHQARVERLDVASGNRIYRVAAEGHPLILKITLDAGTYDRRHLDQHVRYEAALIEQLRARGVATPGVFPARQGLTARIGDHEAILFEAFDGEVCETLEYPVEAAARALAELHQVQSKRPIVLPCRFRYEDLCDIWLPHFERSWRSPQLPAELAAACETLAPIAARFASAEARAALFARSLRLHCHGDVKPRNMFRRADGKVSLFDFDNALLAPRLSDAVDGAIAFALAEQHVDHADFARCTAFLAAYRTHAQLGAEELADLPAWLRFGALVQFTREITTWISSREDIRRRRALLISDFVAGLPALASCASPSGVAPAHASVPVANSA